MSEHTQAVEPAKASGWTEAEEKRIAEIQETTGCDRKEAIRQMRRGLIASKAGGGKAPQPKAKKEKTVKTKKERKPRTKGGKTQEQKRAAWKAYYDDNKAKYRAWARGWRSGGKLTYQEFNKKWEAEHKK
jgi:hypothetical protein